MKETCKNCALVDALRKANRDKERVLNMMLTYEMKTKKTIFDTEPFNLN